MDSFTKTMLKFSFIAVFLSWTSSAQKCPGVSFNYRCYYVDIIKDGISNIKGLTLNDHDNTLYFTFDQIALIPSRGVGFIHLNDKSTGVIDGIRNASSVTIDKRRNRIYIGGDDGLYFLHENKVPEKLPVIDNIKHLFFKDVVYYVNNNRQAYKFEYGIVTLLPELQGQNVDKLIVDDDDNILFLQDRKLFRIKIGTRAINIHERYDVDVITTDYNYKPFICTNSGIYVYNKYKFALDRVSNIVNLRELTFTKLGEPLYAVVDNIMKLNLIPYV